jgi:precorrin-6B methylase 2
MTKRWMGIAVAGTKATLVTAIQRPAQPLEIISDETVDLNSGDRATAYKIMHDRVADRVEQNKIDEVFIKGSAVSLAGMKKAHLEAAELRGVIIAAATVNAKVHIAQSADISRNFGKRKFDDYLKDKDFWAAKICGANLRAGSRAAALLMVAAEA